MTAQYTTRVYQAMKLVTSALTVAAFPGAAPMIYGGDPGKDFARESVSIVGSVRPADAQDWAAIGAKNRNDKFGLEIVVTAYNPGQTADMARDRLEQLTATIETLTRAQAATCYGVTGAWKCSVLVVDPIIAGGDEGYYGYAELTIAFECRI